MPLQAELHFAGRGAHSAGVRVFSAGKNEDGRRVDAFFARALPTLPKSLLYKYMRTGKIKVNGKKPKPETRLSEGDEIKYFGPDEFLPQKENAPKRAGALTVLYEDAHVALLYKPPHVATQPDKTHTDDTLRDRFLWYLYKKGEYTPETEKSFTPALCNRLDFNTRGIVIGAKTLSGAREMNEKIREGKVRKLYLCRVQGVPKEREGIIEGALIKDEKTNKSRIGEGGRAAKTRYKTLRVGKKESLLEVELFTGRSHQIRVHLASIGCPLSGDPKYGTGGSGQALCAYKVRFDFTEETEALSLISGKTFTLPDALLEEGEQHV